MGMEWAVRTGVSDGSNPDAPITREQFATMLWRYMGSPDAAGSLAAYPDAASVHDWAVSAMNWAVQTGIISGSNGYLNPQSTTTRAEMAAMLARCCKAANND
ncbi:MAG: S-layer homology domain-containing protein [Acutalibacter sp.]|nr:S-layer homology domain-containing protein [Acutalibacter sp.]